MAEPTTPPDNQQPVKQNNSPISLVVDDIWHSGEGVVDIMSEPTDVPAAAQNDQEPRINTI